MRFSGFTRARYDRSLNPCGAQLNMRFVDVVTAWYQPSPSVDPEVKIQTPSNKHLRSVRRIKYRRHDTHRWGAYGEEARDEVHDGCIAVDEIQPSEHCPFSLPNELELLVECDEMFISYEGYSTKGMFRLFYEWKMNFQHTGDTK